MSNGVIFRRSHIKRIFRDDDPESDQWVDVERLDVLVFISRIKYPWRKKVWAFDWGSFDPDGLDVDGNKIPKKKVQDPNDDSDPNDENASVVKVPVRAVVVVGTGKAGQYQEYKHYFVNDDSCKTRETHSRRIYHHDIAEGGLDDRNNPPRDPEDYFNSLSDQDEGQFVDVEILDRYWTNEVDGRGPHGERKTAAWQEKKWLINSDTDRLLRDPLLESDKVNLEGFKDISNPSGGEGGEVAGSVTIDPPWRLDPLQNIVNVSWGGLLAVEFYEGDS